MKPETAEHIEKVAEKHLYFKGKDDLSFFFTGGRPWNQRKGSGIYFSFECNGRYESYEVDLTPEFKEWVRKATIDNRDTVSIEAIGWEGGETLMLATNSVILSSNWLNVIETEQFKRFMLECDKEGERLKAEKRK
jgi:hypothetical protein